MNFADYLHQSISDRESILCAGFDLRFEQIPSFFHSNDGSHEERIKKTITDYYQEALEALNTRVACIKPNMAFIERAGFGALRALQEITQQAKNLSLPVILDAKRGDIGSTNLAYAEAYFSPPTLLNETVSSIHTDALTAHLSLGLESVKPFLEVASKSGKGLFFLVRTSNPDSSVFQNASQENGDKACNVMSDWIESERELFTGDSGLSGLGAVVGATHPDEARALRARMPHAFFLIPGFGAQGGSALDAIAARRGEADSLPSWGIIVNSSRGLFKEAHGATTTQSFRESLIRAADQANESLKLAAD